MKKITLLDSSRRFCEELRVILSLRADVKLTDSVIAKLRRCGKELVQHSVAACRVDSSVRVSARTATINPIEDRSNVSN